MARLAQIHASWKQYPGRAPGGTGATGLTPNDAQGYSDMLKEQTEELGLRDQMAGRAGPTISERPQSLSMMDPSHISSLLDPYDPTPLSQQLAMGGLQYPRKAK